MKSKFIIIDGSSLLHRAFYALPPLTTKDGLNTGAVYGFLNMLLKLIQDEQPELIVVAFDKARKTFRNEIFADYKAHRKATPAELSEQFPLACEAVRALGIEVLELEGFEADDIMGTLACAAEKAGFASLIVTADKDALQLIDENTRVLLTKRGLSDVKLVDLAVLKEEYCLAPAQITDLKGLMGDSSDNIPGVPGVGEKTALKLLAEYGSVENLLENAGQIKGKLGEKLRENQELARLSKQLATIDTQAPLVFTPADYKLSPQPEQVEELLDKLEFRNLKNKTKNILFKAGEGFLEAQTAPTAKAAEQVSDSEQAQAELFQDRLAYVLHKVGGSLPNLQLEELEVYSGGQPLLFQAGQPGWEVVLRWLGDAKQKKVALDSKTLYQACQTLGITLQGLSDDCAAAAYLCDPALGKYTLEKLAERFAAGRENLAASELLAEIFAEVKKELAQDNLKNLYQEIEFPLVQVLALMETTGIKVDQKQLGSMSGELAQKLQVLCETITDLAGEEFNINSTKQLGYILFEKIGLPVQKKTKTGYSTDVEVLENLSGLHPIVDNLLEYRMLSKLQSTYLEGLKPLINPESGRIYTHFQQFITATGRLSSTEPNLQNIPVRTSLGKKIREFFVPSAGYDKLMSFDYSQVELRLLAHFSEDALFTEAFLANQDIHTRTAAEVFGVPLENVTGELRSRAKAVNFGIVYGISDYGLARNLGISRAEAAKYIKNYFSRYQGIKNYMDRAVEKARQDGYVATMYGRRRYLPEISSSNFNRRSFAERNAINAPIQGTAADIIKKAMIEVQELLTKEKLRSKLLLQVHDELLFEVPFKEIEILTELVKERMQNTVKLSVPLVVDVCVGDNWAQTKE